MRGLPTSAAYGATKAALINMAESLKFDLDKMGIRIQLINPGFVDTPATQKNEFPMPALVSPRTAAERIAAGLKSQAFEITFPKRFTYHAEAPAGSPTLQSLFRTGEPLDRLAASEPASASSHAGR